MAKLIYPILSYKIVGALYEVYNQLGYGHRERVYQKALEEELLQRKIPYKRELYFPIYFKNKLVSKYFLDFLIDEKIVLELKVSKDYYQSDISQILAYLKSKNYHLGILVIFTSSDLKYRRILN